MREGRDAAWEGLWEGLEDPRMWRLLLARLHPDAGGDQELFAFASAVKDEIYRERSPVRRAVGNRSEPRTRHRERRYSEAFLEDWRRAMMYWSSHNRESLRGTKPW